jgi:hypothetical protein
MPRSQVRKPRSRSQPARPRQRRLAGKGGFRQIWGRIQGATKTPIGRHLMNSGTDAINMALPGSGQFVVALRKLLGLGKYRTSGNDIQASPVPVMHSTLDKGLRVCHSEFLGEISSTVAFTPTTYAINPGMFATFPWLSTIASRFQKWRNNGIVFFFKSTAGLAVAATNNALGDIMGAVQYNYYAPALSTKQDLLLLSGSSNGKPAENQIFPVEARGDISRDPVRIIRNSGVSGDYNNYDWGKFTLATSGCQGANVVGNLYVCYDITLIQPRLFNQDIFYAATLNSVDNTHPLGTSVTIGQAPVPSTAVSVSGNVITFSGVTGNLFSIIYSVTGTSAAVTAPVYAYSGCAVSTGPYNSPANGETCTKFGSVVNIAVTASPATVTFGAAGTLPSSVSSATLFVSSFPAAS